MNKLIFDIIALSCISWLFIYSTPSIVLKTYLKSKIKLLNNDYVSELMDCLTCSSFWITFFGLFLLDNQIFICVGGAAIASVFITFLDGYIKFKI